MVKEMTEDNAWLIDHVHSSPIADEMQLIYCVYLVILL